MLEKSDYEEIVLNDLVTWLNSQIVPMIVGQMLVSLLIAWAAWPYAGPLLTLGWLAFILAPHLVKPLVYWPLANSKELTAKEKMAISSMSSVYGGTLQGLAVVLFLPVVPGEAGLLPVVSALFTYAAGSGCFMGYKRARLSFAIPCLGLSAATMLWLIWSQPGHEDYAFLLLLLVLATVSIEKLSNIMFEKFSEASILRWRYEQLNDQLENALTTSQAANQAKTRFLASASHDLRQPMHTLSLYSATLMMQPLDEKSKKITQRMDIAVSTLTTQLDSLLDISKLDAGIVETNPELVSIPALLHRLVSSVSGEIDSSAVTLGTDCAENLVMYTDPVLLERVLRNLLTNAMKFTSTGDIEISAFRLENQLKFRVRDSGIGITDTEIGRIFEEFYQTGNPERDRKKGMGLGLAIVERLVRLLNGSIDVSSTPGIGTTFTVTLRELQPVHSVLAGDTPERLEWSPKRVMVVDDEQDVRESMQSLLEELGCEVNTQSDIVSSVTAFAAFSPDLVLVDFRLRDNEDGVDLIKRLRKLRPNCPALLVSGDIAADRLEKANNERVLLLHKPVQVEGLKQAMMQVCSAQAPNINKKSGKAQKC